MYASHCLYICSLPLHACVPHITSALPLVYIVLCCTTTGLYSPRYCHHYQTLPLHCGTVTLAGLYSSRYCHYRTLPLHCGTVTLARPYLSWYCHPQVVLCPPMI
jgi:hypothetical protein